ncbi:DUF1642 domain-containing protein [Lactococcus lactis]|uniref:DUF1642 domain-containing protein n=1 Tax=Lactococcus lactis TaxID=1358 RepID=UPI001E34D9D3|nr:DUF1642 domain-containing protein [Lactococcus lactis]
MTKEMKRPTSHISGNSIKPALSKAVEFYTDNNRQAYECIRERDDYIDYLERKLNNASQQQALPVVPECVAGAIESLSEHYSAFEAISLINAKVNALPEENEDWLPVYNWLCEGIGNQNIFALAFITGKYEVEKPQLFYLREKNTGYYLRKKGNNEYGITPHYSNDYDEKYMHYKFTQSEIDSMETGSYEQIKAEKEK